VKRTVILSLLATFIVVGCGSPASQTAGASAKIVHATDRKVSQNPLNSVQPTAEGSDHSDADDALHHSGAGQQQLATGTTNSGKPKEQAGAPSEAAGDPSNTLTQGAAPATPSTPTSSQTHSGKPAKRESRANPSYVNYWNTLPALQNSGRYIVLTFDDGPSPYTAQLIQILNAEHIPTVMFWNTYHLNFADHKVLSLLENSPDIMLGDHTVDHANLVKLGRAQQYREIVDAQKAIERKTGRPVVYFRPPYGNYNRVTEDVLNQSHLTCVMWSVDSLDWKFDTDERAILKTIKSQLRPGAVVLLHDRRNTLKFLPDIIAMIRAQGYEFTTFAADSGN
jgi:peptidoglycan/xylan/chitin deacetylase (PgdA/CDA1 family)